MGAKGTISTVEDPGDSKLMLWIRDHRDYPNEYCCLIWPFARLRDGYGTIGRDNTVVRVHRFMCELRNGPPPTDKHQAAHSCGRGDHGCVNPNHLSWKTPRENQLDRTDSKGRPQRKLTPADVDEIRAMQGREHVAVTAGRFNTSEANIRRVQAGKTWRRDRPDIRIFSDDEVRAIRTSPKTAREAALEFNASRTQVSRIRQGASYNYVSDLSADRGTP